MTLEEELKLSYYKRICALNASHGVWLVQHPGLGRFFVLKHLTVYDRALFERLKEEPVEGTPRIYEAVEHEGVLTVVEEYINAEPLSSVLIRRGALPEAEAVDRVLKLARIVARLHALKPPVIHRDVKPSNVLVSETGEVWLVDLDAAKSYKQGEGRDTELFGTPGYAAPEQYGFGSSSPETDIYAMGRLLQELLSGELGSSEGVSKRMVAVIEKSTAVDPKGRYPSAMEFVWALTDAGNADGLHIKRVKGERRKRTPKFSYFRPLGFRSFTLWKMLLALLAYAGIFAACTCMKGIGKSDIQNWIIAVWFFLIIFVLIQFPANFCRVLDVLGINRIKKKGVKIAVIVVFEIVLFFLMWIPFGNYMN